MREHLSLTILLGQADLVRLFSCYLERWWLLQGNSFHCLYTSYFGKYSVKSGNFLHISIPVYPWPVIILHTHTAYSYCIVLSVWVFEHSSRVQNPTGQFHGNSDAVKHKPMITKLNKPYNSMHKDYFQQFPHNFTKTHLLEQCRSNVWFSIWWHQQHNQVFVWYAF
jgi:hypothetical protein